MEIDSTQVRASAPVSSGLSYAEGHASASKNGYLYKWIVSPMCRWIARQARGWCAGRIDRARVV